MSFGVAETICSCVRCPELLSTRTRTVFADGQVPVAGRAVSIPAGHTVVLDVSPPELKGLEILGTLRFDRTKDLSLTVNWIIVEGTLEIGTEANPVKPP